MTYTQEEAQKAAHELVEATYKVKELQVAIKDYKAGLLEYAEIEQLSDTSWHAQNGYVELTTKTKYKLSDIPAESKISSDIIDEEVAENVFDTKVTLSKEGKKLLREQDPQIMALMIPESKVKIDVILNVDPSKN